MYMFSILHIGIEESEWLDRSIVLHTFFSIYTFRSVSLFFLSKAHNRSPEGKSSSALTDNMHN